MTVGFSPRYGAMPRPPPPSPSLVSYTASMSDHLRPASSSAAFTDSTLICMADRPGATRNGYSWIPTMAASRRWLAMVSLHHACLAAASFSLDVGLSTLHVIVHVGVCSAARA